MPTESMQGVNTFADFQVYGVLDILHQLLTAPRLLKHEPLQMENQHRWELFQGHPAAYLDLKAATE